MPHGVQLLRGLFFAGILLIQCSSSPIADAEVAAGDGPVPIVFIPGKCGSQIEIKIDRRPEDSQHSHCPHEMDWHRIWLDVYQFLWPGQLECWAENIQLHYNKETRKAEYATGTEFRVPGFGNTSTVEYLDDSWTAYLLGNIGQYFAAMTAQLNPLGYINGVNLRAAPYDFRFAPHSQGEHYEQLKALVEDTYEINGQRKVAILAHSMGGIHALYFLHTVSQEWKDKYIHSFFPINSPWKGTVIVSNLYTSGYNYGITPLSQEVVRRQQRSWETGVMMLPQPDAWGPKDVLVVTPTRNYTAHNYDQYFRDVDYLQGQDMYDNIRHQSYDMGHPGVDTYCVYSYGLETPEYLVYAEGQFPNGTATMVMGPGDGTVNIRSLEYCKTWLVEGEEEHVAAVKTFEHIPHIDLLFHEKFLKFFLKKLKV